MNFRSAWAAIAGLLLLFLPFPASGEAHLVRDIEPTNSERWVGSSIPLWPDYDLAGSYPRFLTPVGARILFFADDLVHGDEPWVSDGTAEGTRLLLDICPGVCGAHPEIVGTLGGVVFFVARDAEHGRELWRTDGTLAGTRMVTDLCPGSCSGFDDAGWDDVRAWAPLDREFTTPLRAFAIAGRQYFPAQSSPHANRLWSNSLTDETPQLLCSDCGWTLTSATDFRGHAALLVGDRLVESDGTAAGTRTLSWCSAAYAAVHSLAVTGGDLLFAGFCAAHKPTSYSPPVEPDLYRSDGTLAGTVKLASRAAEPWVVDGRIFFLRSGAPLGSLARWTLWSTAGDPASERQVAGPVLSLVPLGTAAGRLFFTGSTPESYYDGAVYSVAAGDITATELAAGLAASFRLVDGVALFALSHTPITFESPCELWRSDGTLAGSRSLTPPGLGVGQHTDQVLCLDDHFAVAGRNVFFSAYESVHGDELWAIDRTEATGATCFGDDQTLCLGGRYAARLTFHSPALSGPAHPRALTADSGMFWFFDAGNPEVMVKVLDGTSVNGRHWVFFGSLSDVEYRLEVEDTVTGAKAAYDNPHGQYCGRADIEALPGGFPAAGSARPRSSSAAPSSSPALSPSACAADDTTLCLAGGRFQVRVDWQAGGSSGAGRSIPFSSEAGLFWFFSPDNLELTVKILDGRAVNGRIWVFYGALSDVAYDLRVLDTSTGVERTYHNDSGHYCGRADVEAF